MRKIGISIPTFNRPFITLEAFKDVYSDERIDSITINDDCSDIGAFISMSDQAKSLSKIRFHRNISNIDCYQNKHRAIWLSPNEWNILLDSDNKIDPINYLDPIYSIEEWDKNTIYTPEHAAPHFDFREYTGLTITKENVASYLFLPVFETMLNAANYFVNKDEYLRVWDSGEKTDPVTSDSIFVAYKWLAAGNKIHVLKGLQYYHKVWEESHYRLNVSRTPKGFHDKILNDLKVLK
jgi:hypothetical protein